MSGAAEPLSPSITDFHPFFMHFFTLHKPVFFPSLAHSLPRLPFNPASVFPAPRLQLVTCIAFLSTLLPLAPINVPPLLPPPHSSAQSISVCVYVRIRVIPYPCFEGRCVSVFLFT